MGKDIVRPYINYIRLPLTQACGRAVRYASMLTLDFRKKSVLDADPVPNKEDYMKIGVTVRKNHCTVTSNPYKKCDYFVEYGKGTDTSGEIIDAAITNGYIVKAGAWIREYDETTGDVRVLPNGTEAKWNGMKAFKTFLDENEEYFLYLKDKVEGKIKVEDMTEEEVQEIIKSENKNEEFISNLEEVMVEQDKKKTTKSKKKEAAK